MELREADREPFTLGCMRNIQPRQMAQEVQEVSRVLARRVVLAIRAGSPMQTRKTDSIG
jgi:hypothetical protein